MKDETLQKLRTAFSIGASNGEACYYAGISRETLNRYIKSNPKFGEEKESLKQKPILQARQTLVDGIVKDRWLALNYLERKRKKEFSKRTENVNETKVVLDDGVAKKMEEFLKKNDIKA